MSRPRPHVVVVGAGMAGLAAARALRAGGTDVTVLEAADEVGGCVRSVAVAGHTVDVGAEALHTAVPGPLELVTSLGLADELVTARRTHTWLERDGRLRPLPPGVGPAGPTRLGGLVTSRTLSPRGLARAALEPLLPRRHDPRRDGDVSVAEAVGARFGGEVVDRILDPLLGGLHAGDVRRLSLDAAAPQLSATLARTRSVVLASRRRAGGDHGFVSLRGGLATLPLAMAASLDGAVRTGTAVSGIVDTGRAEGRYEVTTGDGELVTADGVVVALPTAPAAGVLRDLAGDAAEVLAQHRAATVAVVLLAYPAAARETPALSGTGVLIPSGSDRLLKSATFLSTKWPHLADDGHVLVRASAGRARDDRVRQLGDAAVATQVVDDLAEVVGLDPAPTSVVVTRWPEAMPQLEVGHRDRVAAARGHLAAHPAVALAGSAYDGVGVGGALRSGAAAAATVLATLEEARR